MKLSPKKIKYILLFFLPIFFFWASCRPEKKSAPKSSLSKTDTTTSTLSPTPSETKPTDSTNSFTEDTRNFKDSLNKSIASDIPQSNSPTKTQTDQPKQHHSHNTTSSFKPTVTEQDVRQGQAVIEKYHPLDDPDPTPDPDPDEFVQVDSDPVLLNWEELKAQIKKPPHLANVSGTVYLKVLISRKGFYRGHLVRRSPHPELTAEVVKAVKQIRAKPATYQGKPVKVWINLSYEFK